jgi:preprotein translocase subunit Sec61beta
MAQENKMQMPGVFGGLMRYDSEYKSKFQISPAAIIAFVAAVVIFVFILKIFFPIPPSFTTGGNVPVGPGGLVFPLILSFLGVKI